MSGSRIHPRYAPEYRRLRDVALDELLARHGGAAEIKAFLVAKGYVCQERPDDPSWGPGIPSMMDYMVERIPPP